MIKAPNDDQPGFVAEEPEHCHACYRLIQPGQTYYLTIGQAVLCEDCIGAADAIRVADDLVVVVEDGRLLVRRNRATVEILPSKAWHPGVGTVCSRASGVRYSPIPVRVCLTF